MILLKFSRLHQPSTMPLQLVFGEGSAPIIPVEYIGIMASASWIKPGKVSLLHSLAWHSDSVASAHQLSYSVGDSQWLTSRFKWSDGVSISKEIIVSFNKSSNITNECVIPWFSTALHTVSHDFTFKGNHLAADINDIKWRDNTQCYYYSKTQYWKKITNRYESMAAHWVINPDFEMQSIKINYGPTPLEYVCYRVAHPEIGRVKLTFNGLRATSSSIKLTFKLPEKICQWGEGGGLLRAHDDLPILNRKIPIEPQLRSSYIVKPEILCVRTNDNQEILITGFDYQTSRSQFAATSTIKFCSRIDYERALNQLLKITVNGYDFFVFIEKPSTNRRFNYQSYSASGRSRFSELSAPTARTSSHTNQTTKTLLGLMSEIVEYSGWSIFSQIIDYPVQALAFSYSGKTPAEALVMCASAIGARLNIDDANKKIEVLPYWPVMPWDTDSAICDVIINDSLITQHNTTLNVKN